MSMPNIKQIKAYNLSSLASYLTVRWKVYINEFQREITEEFGINDIKASHYLFIEKRKVIGVARILYHDNMAELGRITIVKKYRDQGYGKEMMKQIINKVYDNNKAEMIRLYTIDEKLVKFYHQFGFIENGETYFNNVPYTTMVKALRNREDKI